MRPIRKFVRCTKVAAGFGAAVAVALTAQTALARDADSAVRSAPASQVTLSPACRAAITDLKTAITNDRQEDLQEAAERKLNPTATSDPAEDAAEHADIKALFDKVRSACASEIAGITASKPPAAANLSAACTTALQAWKTAARAIWTQGTRPTSAQVAQLQTLAAAARSACGSPAWRWEHA